MKMQKKALGSDLLAVKNYGFTVYELYMVSKGLGNCPNKREPAHDLGLLCQKYKT
jgi:hypothetical protein